MLVALYLLIVDVSCADSLAYLAQGVRLHITRVALQAGVRTATARYRRGVARRRQDFVVLGRLAP